MKLKGVDYGRVNVNFSDPYAYCQTTNRDNTQWMDLFLGRGNARRKHRESSKGSFFSPGWTISFKLPWLPVQLISQRQLKI